MGLDLMDNKARVAGDFEKRFDGMIVWRHSVVINMMCAVYCVV